MRGGFLSGGVFWGIFLIVWGVLALLRSFFNISLPIFRIMVALFFIYVGVSVLMGGFTVAGDRSTVLFGERTIVGDSGSREYNIIFGSGLIDLSRLSPSDTDSVEVNVIFGNGRVRIDPAVPLRVVASTAFGSVSLPNGNAMLFGEHSYTTPAYAGAQNGVKVEVNAVFGSAVVAE